jgi:RimJ/RimL family protein N-acetyltransferase
MVLRLFVDALPKDVDVVAVNDLVSVLGPKPLSSVMSFWKWVHTTFQLLYIIEIEKSDTRRIIGVLGIYNMQVGRELWVSLLVFDSKYCGRGYGRSALRVLLSSLQKDRTLRRVCGEVSLTNIQSLRLLQRLGFLTYGHNEDRLLLQKSLRQCKETAYLWAGCSSCIGCGDIPIRRL